MRRQNETNDKEEPFIETLGRSGVAPRMKLSLSTDIFNRIEAKGRSSREIQEPFGRISESPVLSRRSEERGDSVVHSSEFVMAGDEFKENADFDVERIVEGVKNVDFSRCLEEIDRENIQSVEENERLRRRIERGYEQSSNALEKVENSLILLLKKACKNFSSTFENVRNKLLSFESRVDCLNISVNENIKFRFAKTSVKLENIQSHFNKMKSIISNNKLEYTNLYNDYKSILSEQKILIEKAETKEILQKCIENAIDRLDAAKDQVQRVANFSDSRRIIDVFFDKVKCFEESIENLDNFYNENSLISKRYLEIANANKVFHEEIQVSQQETHRLKREIERSKDISQQVLIENEGLRDRLKKHEDRFKRFKDIQYRANVGIMKLNQAPFMNIMKILEFHNARVKKLSMKLKSLPKASPSILLELCSLRIYRYALKSKVLTMKNSFSKANEKYLKHLFCLRLDQFAKRSQIKQLKGVRYNVNPNAIKEIFCLRLFRFANRALLKEARTRINRLSKNQTACEGYLKEIFCLRLLQLTQRQKLLKLKSRPLGIRFDSDASSKYIKEIACLRILRFTNRIKVKELMEQCKETSCAHHLKKIFCLTLHRMASREKILRMKAKMDEYMRENFCVRLLKTSNRKIVAELRAENDELKRKISGMSIGDNQMQPSMKRGLVFSMQPRVTESSKPEAANQKIPVKPTDLSLSNQRLAELVEKQENQLKSQEATIKALQLKCKEYEQALLHQSTEENYRKNLKTSAKPGFGFEGLESNQELIEKEFQIADLELKVGKYEENLQQAKNMEIGLLDENKRLLRQINSLKESIQEYEEIFGKKSDDLLKDIVEKNRVIRNLQESKEKVEKELQKAYKVIELQQKRVKDTLHEKENIENSIEDQRVKYNRIKLMVKMLKSSQAEMKSRFNRLIAEEIAEVSMCQSKILLKIEEESESSPIGSFLGQDGSLLTKIYMKKLLDIITANNLNPGTSATEYSMVEAIDLIQLTFTNLNSLLLTKKSKLKALKVQVISQQAQISESTKDNEHLSDTIKNQSQLINESLEKIKALQTENENFKRKYKVLEGKINTDSDERSGLTQKIVNLEQSLKLFEEKAKKYKKNYKEKKKKCESVINDYEILYNHYTALKSSVPEESST